MWSYITGGLNIKIPYHAKLHVGTQIVGLIMKVVLK